MLFLFFTLVVRCLNFMDEYRELNDWYDILSFKKANISNSIECRNCLNEINDLLSRVNSINHKLNSQMKPSGNVLTREQI